MEKKKITIEVEPATAVATVGLLRGIFPSIIEQLERQAATNHTVLPAKPYSYLPATSGRGERVSNGLPGQTVKGRNCNTEEGGCFGNAEAPDDDHCNPAHVWNFSFLVCP